MKRIYNLRIKPMNVILSDQEASKRNSILFREEFKIHRFSKTIS